MATENDEAMLRRIWNRENLGKYEGQWIAFRERVLASDENFAVVSDKYVHEIREGKGPLFAYVTFQVRA